MVSSGVILSSTYRNCGLASDVLFDGGVENPSLFAAGDREALNGPAVDHLARGSVAHSVEDGDLPGRVLLLHGQGSWVVRDLHGWSRWEGVRSGVTHRSLISTKDCSRVG